MLSRQNLPMPLLRVVLQFLSLAVSVMDILVMSQDEASARRTKRARAHIISLRKYFTPRMVRNPPPRILENLLENEIFLSPRDVRIK